MLLNHKNPLEKKEIKIKETENSKVVLTHFADKNITNTTFGGTLMRECFELAYITAYL